MMRVMNGVAEQLVQYCVLRKLAASKVPQRWSTRPSCVLGAP